MSNALTQKGSISDIVRGLHFLQAGLGKNCEMDEVCFNSLKSSWILSPFLATCLRFSQSPWFSNAPLKCLHRLVLCSAGDLEPLRCPFFLNPSTPSSSIKTYLSLSQLAPLSRVLLGNLIAWIKLKSYACNGPNVSFLLSGISVPGVYMWQYFGGMTLSCHVMGN